MSKRLATQALNSTAAQLTGQFPRLTESKTSGLDTFAETQEIQSHQSWHHIMHMFHALYQQRRADRHGQFMSWRPHARSLAWNNCYSSGCYRVV